MSTIPAILALADGTVFTGRAIGAAGHTVGEVVFNTAITGYQEILTDPSYTRQLVTLTYPHIGNVGANAEDTESRGVFAAGAASAEKYIGGKSAKRSTALQKSKGNGRGYRSFSRNVERWLQHSRKY